MEKNRQNISVKICPKLSGDNSSDFRIPIKIRANSKIRGLFPFEKWPFQGRDHTKATQKCHLLMTIGVSDSKVVNIAIPAILCHLSVILGSKSGLSFSGSFDSESA